MRSFPEDLVFKEGKKYDKDGDWCFCSYMGKEVKAGIFGVTGKLSHDTQPAHVSGAIAGIQASCHSSNCQIAVSGKRLELTMWSFIAIFLFSANLEVPVIPLIYVIRTAYGENMINTVDEEQGLGLISYLNMKPSA